MLFKKRGLRSSRMIKKKKRIHLVRSFLVAGILISLTAILSLGSHIPEMTIQSVAVQGTALLFEEDLQEYAEDKISGKYWKIFRRANFIIYPRNSIKEGLLDTYPELLNVATSLQGLQALTVNIEERTPIALWCGEELPRDDESGSVTDPVCYFIDAKSVIFKEAPHFRGVVFFEIYGKIQGEKVRTNSSKEAPLGVLLMDENKLKRIMAFSDVFNAMGMSVLKLVYTEDNDAFFLLKNNVKIIFNREQDFEETLNNLESIFDAGELLRSDFVDRATTLEYIDLRFPNRVFFKLL